MVATSTPKVQAEEDVAARMRMVVGKLSRSLRLTHADPNLSPSQHDVLGTLVRRGPLGLSQLASDENLNPTMLSRIAGKLETAGLIVRTADPGDGRAALLEATTDGQAMYEQIKSERTAALLRAIDELSERERATLVTAMPALEALTDAVRRQIP